jgi:hypothetical protein
VKQRLEKLEMVLAERMRVNRRQMVQETVEETMRKEAKKVVMPATVLLTGLLAVLLTTVLVLLSMAVRRSLTKWAKVQRQ